MRILQVTNKVPYPAKDGGAIACMNLAKGFSQLGHELTILSMNTQEHPIDIDEIPEEIRHIADFRIIDVPPRISVYWSFINLLFSKKPYNAIRFISRSFSKELKKLLTEKTFDVIQLEGLYVCPYIPAIRKKTNAWIVYRAHNIESEIWERTAQNAKGLKQLYLKNLSKRILKFETSLLNQYDLLVPITARDETILETLGNCRPSFVSQTGIENSVVPSSKNLEYPSLFYLGSLEWTPNQEGLVWFIEKCWPVLHKKYPCLKFYIAGRNAPVWMKKKLERPNIVFKGEVDDAYEFMNSKAIMIVPLFSGSGMRVKIVEGMALGKSIVTTPVGAEGIKVEDGKHLLISQSVTEYINAVSILTEDKALFDQTGKNAIEFVHQNFDNLAIAEKLIGFYSRHIQ